jgi:hypothetical protein
MTTGNPSSASLWSGRVLTALVTLFMIADAVVDIFRPRLVQAEMAATGFPEDQVHLVGAIILVCAAFYAIPRTSVLGAILMTGFLGGAICTHFRVGEIATPPQLVSLLLGGSAWGALYLRDPRVRTLLPLVRPNQRPEALDRRLGRDIESPHNWPEYSAKRKDHGYAGVKERGLERFARAFTEAETAAWLAAARSSLASNSKGSNVD